MGHSCELSLTPQGAELVGDLCHVELLPIVKDHYPRNAKAGDDIFSDKLPDFSRSDGTDDLSFHPFGEIIDHNKEVLPLTCGFGKGSQYVHSPGGKR